MDTSYLKLSWVTTGYLILSILVVLDVFLNPNESYPEGYVGFTSCTYEFIGCLGSYGYVNG